MAEDVVQYLRYFKRMMEEENVAEIRNLYEHGFPDLTDRFFREKLWPDEHAVEAIVGSGAPLFLLSRGSLGGSEAVSPPNDNPAISLTHS